NGADMASLSALPARQRLASRLLACTAVGLAGAAISASAAAQTTLPPVTVEGTATSNPQKEPVAVPRIPNSVQDTPQAIQVIPQEQIRDQGAITLGDVLRNVPGMTVMVGEGGGGMNGDQFRLRGLDAKGDIYTDGLREFGVFTRDAFNIEEVQVLKGPSSQSFGRGTTGGAILSQSKLPTLENFQAGTAAIGMGLFLRGTVDVNRKISDTIAVRLNAMATDQEIVDRDRTESERWAVAPSVAFGLGTNTTFSLAYLHVHDDRIPDYGVPIVIAPGDTVGKPVTEHGVDRSNWYGTVTDRDETTQDQLTARFQHKANDWFTVYNDTRLGFYDRYFTASPANCQAACVTALFDNNPATEPMRGLGGPGPYEQDGWGVQNIVSAVADFKLASFRNQLVGGIDVSHEEDSRHSFSYSPARPTTSLLDPNPANTNNYQIIDSTAATAFRDTDSTNIGVFVSDRFWFTEQISIIGGVRWDSFDTSSRTRGPTGPETEVSTSSDAFSPMTSLVVEPTANQTYYVSYAQSVVPQGAFASNAPTPVNANTNDLEPEKHKIYEAGAKIGLLDGKLGLSGSVFRIDKSNAKETDPTTGAVTSSGDEQRVQGFELAASGRITERWFVNATYSFLDARTTDSTNANNRDKDVPFVPTSAFSVWTTYMPISNLTVGGGVTYRDAVYLNAANTQQVPADVSFDALVAYQFEHIRLAVNAYNLTDELNYSTIFGNRAVPAPGRTVIFTAGVMF
ncbi:MAG: TonB-dependent receptor, partial [Rhodospirillaceae bacterium]